MASGRTLHVRCTTWEQVEVFHTRKLRKGKLLSMKVPFPTAVGAQVTLGLELPNDVVIAIDGTVLKASPIEGSSPTPSGKPESGKTWIEVELHGFTDEVIARIRAMAGGGAPPAAAAVAKSGPTMPRARTDDLPADERQLFQRLTAELRRMRQVAVHDVLGVSRDADAETIRRAWMSLVRRHHPDLVVRRNAPAITHLAEELTILCNRAYERLRAALIVEGRGTALGPGVKSKPGWLVGFDELSSVDAAARPELRVTAKAATIPPVNTTSSAAAPGAPLQGGDAFETRARAMLGEGDADNAQEVLAAALCVYPRSRPLRSLYYVASAVAALNKGEVMLATSQLETALAHHEQCSEAAQLLEHLRKTNGNAEVETMKRLFR